MTKIFPVLVVIAVSGFLSCKKHEPFKPFYPHSPSCSIAQSRVSEAFTFDDKGDTSYKASFQYDTQNRLISVTESFRYGNEYTSFETISYTGDNTIVRKTEKRDIQNIVTFRMEQIYLLDNYGRNVKTTCYRGNDTQNITTRYMYYDGSGQLTTSATYSSDKIINSYTAPIMLDSTLYEWEDGNIAACRGYADVNIQTYSYLTGSDGRNAFIAGYDDLHLLYNPAVKQAFLKNLVREPSADYFFDKQQRIWCKKKTSDSRCYYLYKCI